MIGAMYTSDQRIVDIYRDKSTLAESSESKLSADEVLNYFEWISVANKSYINFKPLRKMQKAC